MRAASKFYSNIRGKTRNPNMDTDVIDIYLHDAIEELKSDYQLPEAYREEPLRIFTDVNQYPLPIPTGATETDLESISDLVEYFEGTTSESRFNKIKPARFARKYRKGYQDDYIAKYVRNTQNMLLVDINTGRKNVLLNSCNSLTDNGAWVASGNSENLAVDNQTYVEGGKSLKFDVTGTAAAPILTCTDMNAVDLTDYENDSSIFMQGYFPAVNTLTSVTLRWGSSASNYFYKTITTQFNGLDFAKIWDLLAFEWASATEVGTVDVTAINYLQYRPVFSAAPTTLTNFRIDNIVCRQGLDMYLLFNSSMYVKSAAGVLQKTFEEATDSFIGDNTSADLVETKALQRIFELEIIDDMKADKMEKKYKEMLRNIRSRTPERSMNESFVWTAKGL